MTIVYRLGANHKELAQSELDTIRYALDQQIMTLNALLREGETAIVPELKETFQGYIDNMQDLLDRLPEVMN